jgi:hypothetical protein
LLALRLKPFVVLCVLLAQMALTPRGYVTGEYCIACGPDTSGIIRANVTQKSMTDASELIKQGIVALKAGQKAQARSLFEQALQQNKQSEMAWLWLSGAVDTNDERRACLETVLSINPNNGPAQRGLAQLPPKLPSPPPKPVTVSAPPRPEPVTAPVVPPPKALPFSAIIAGVAISVLFALIGIAVWLNQSDTQRIAATARPASPPHTNVLLPTDTAIAPSHVTPVLSATTKTRVPTLTRRPTLTPSATRLITASLTPQATRTPFYTFTPRPTATPVLTRPTPTLFVTFTPRPTRPPQTPTTTPTPFSVERNETQKLGPITGTARTEFTMQVTLKSIDWTNGAPKDAPPEGGHIYGVVHLRIKNVGPGAKHPIARADFQLQDAEGISGDAFILSAQDCILKFVDLAPGGETQGCVVFKAPLGGRLKLIYNPNRYAELQPGTYLSFELR